MITREIIDEIKSRLDIVDIISDYIDLKKVGKNYRALCPFHAEKTPSFYVSPEKQIYHCFGCGASGDVIKFVQEYEKISFMDALKKLADRAGIQLQIDSKKNMYDTYHTILEKLAGIYHEILLKNSKVLEYLIDERGLSLNVIRRFKIGLCPKESDHAVDVLKKIGLSDKEGEKLGILKRTKYGFVDFFEGRITFPICNEMGKVIGFGGRVLHEGMDQPKYLNTIENPYFKKGRVLYGIDKAKNVIKSSKFAVLVEGYMDLLALHSCGIENTVAILGTSSSRYHIKLLSRFCRNFLVFFDGDDAGRKATLDFLKNADDFDVSIMVLNPKDGDAKDPGELYLKLGCNGLKEFLKSAVDYEDFLVNELSKNLNLRNISGMEEFLRRMKRFSVYMALRKPIRFERLVKKVSSMLNLSETMIKMYLSSSSNTDEKLKENMVKMEEKNIFDDEDMMIKIFIEHDELRSKVLNVFEKYRDFLSNLGRELLDYSRTLNDLGDFTPDDFISELDGKLSNRFFKILTWDFEPQDLNDVILDCEKYFENLRIKKRIEEIDELLKNVKDSKKRELMKLRMELLAVLKRR